MREEGDGSGMVVKVGAALGLGGLVVFARLGDSCTEVGRVGAKVAAEVPASTWSHGVDEVSQGGLDVARHADPADVMLTAFELGDLTLQLADLGMKPDRIVRSDALGETTVLTAVGPWPNGLALLLAPVGTDLPALTRQCLAVGTWCLAAEDHPGVRETFTLLAAENRDLPALFLASFHRLVPTPMAWLEAGPTGIALRHAR